MDFLKPEHEEYQYLRTLHLVSTSGILKPNRTDNKTKSIFGNMMKFTLSDGEKRILPLLTTKNMTKSSEGIFEELDFFIHSRTDAKILHNAGVKIWDQNTSREFLDKIGLKHYEEGTLGPLYGYQWRHFGAPYINCHTDYTGKGFDQLQWIIDEIKKNPYNRRLLVTAWNPLQISEGVLAPCHVMFQFNVIPDPHDFEMKPKYLDCLLFQRSADLPLGVPYNIASYATLTHIIARLTNLVPHELVYVTGDTHIYENQLHLVPGQLFRKPYPFPEIEFNFGDDPIPTNINDYKAKYIKLKNYQHWPLISYPFTA